MKAVVQDTYGPPEVMALGEIEKPPVTADRVLVRVRAASVNPPDWAGVTGVPYVARLASGLRRPRLRVRGSDLAGTVEAVGTNVARLKVGDEVFGMGAETYAEYASAPKAKLATKPANITFEQAAGVPMAGITALQGLRDAGGLQSGQEVLINGAGGGIGTFAVQIAKAYGATVTGCCGTDKLELVRSLGADHVIDYTKQDFTESAERYDLIFDNVLNHSLSRLLHALRPTGTLVPNGGQFYKRWFASTGVILIKAPLLSLFARRRIRSFHAAGKLDDLLILRELMETGKVTPVVDRVYPLSAAPDAIRYFGAGHARGKVVIAI